MTRPCSIPYNHTFNDTLRRSAPIIMTRFGRHAADARALASRSLVHSLSIQPTPLDSNRLQTTKHSFVQKPC